MIGNLQGWEFAHLLIAHLLIRSFCSNQMSKWATKSDSLRSLKTNEWPWANHSGHSEEMSDCEQIAQVAQEKWATVSDSLRLLRRNERFAQVAQKKWANERFAQKILDKKI